MLPNDPGPGANAGGAAHGPDYPAPLDFSIALPGTPFLARSGPGFEWLMHDGKMKLVISFVVAGSGLLHRVLEPNESGLLLEWLLRAAEVRDAG